MDLNALLAEFGSQTGLQDCALNAEGVCRLVFDGDLVVDVEQGDADENTFFLYSVVGTLPGAEPAILRRLLGANLFGRGTNDAILALDESLDEIVLFRRCEGKVVDFTAFELALTEFVDQLEYWRAELAQGKQEKGGIDDTAPSPDRPPNRMIRA